MSRTRIEIQEELTALGDLLNEIPTTSSFGDNNQEAINAQIRVISYRMTVDELLSEYEDEVDYTLSAAMDALRWLRDDDEPASESWNEMLAESEESSAPAVDTSEVAVMVS